MEIEDKYLCGNTGIERVIIFYLSKLPIYGNYVNGMGSGYIKED